MGLLLVNSVKLISLGYYLLSSMMQLLSSLLLLFVLLGYIQAAPSPSGPKYHDSKETTFVSSKGFKRMAGDEMADPSSDLPSPLEFILRALETTQKPNLDDGCVVFCKIA